MAGLSDKAIKTNYAENKYRYNKGSELQNKEFSDGSGLEMYDAHARALDPQLGRFWQIDPKPDEEGQESLTTYQFGTDDPIKNNDPSGKCPTCILGAIIGAAVDYGAQVLKNKLEGQSWSESLSNVNVKEIAVAAVAGFATSGVSALFADAAVAGTSMALSKGAANAIVAGTASVLNQANDASDKGQALNISPAKIVTDIATDKLSDHLSEKIPEIKINGSDAPKLSYATKTTASGAISKVADAGKELVSAIGSGKVTPKDFGTLNVVNQTDASAHKIYLPKPINK